MAVSKSRELKSALERNSSHWEKATAPGLTRLLRLGLLRDFVHQIHTKRSEMMATPDCADLAEFTRCEEYLNQSFSHLELDELSLENVVDLSLKGKIKPNFKRSKPLIKKSVMESQPGLSTILNPDRLTRPDRYWELEIALEAIGAHWNIEVLGATCEVHEVEKFSRFLSDAIWPNAVVLFVESGGLSSPPHQKSDVIFWRGHWFLAVNPDWNKALISTFFPHANFQWSSLNEHSEGVAKRAAR